MKTNRYTIYVGLNDKDSTEQEFETEKLERVLYHVLQSYHVSFTIARFNGGYFHDNGTFVKENSFQITLIGGTQDIIDAVAEDICAFFNQETVLVVRDEVDSYMVRNSVKEKND